MNKFAWLIIMCGALLLGNGIGELIKFTIYQLGLFFEINLAWYDYTYYLDFPIGLLSILTGVSLVWLGSQIYEEKQH